MKGIRPMNITSDILYVGVSDHQIDLFEGQYKVPQGMSYNSYVILDEKIAVLDTVDQHFGHEWLDNLQKALNGKKPDYLVVHHMEPDHSANIANFMKLYPETTLVSSAKAFAMMGQFFGTEYEENRKVVAEGDTLELGRHSLSFVGAPMVHWPEVLMSYDQADKVLFSADAFGKFGAADVSEPWDDEARRYYIGIVGKYGPQVQNVLKKAGGLEIEKICSLHGPVLTENLSHYLNLYNTWSSYMIEEEGILIAYTSVYGHTKKAVELLTAKLKEKGCPKVVVRDLSRDDMSEAVADAFRYGKIVLATTTYNADIFPYMRDFIHRLTERNFQGRTVAFMENGSWAPQAAKIMRSLLEGCKNTTLLDRVVHIKSELNDESKEELQALADELCKEYVAKDSTVANKNDMKALFKIGYGLYVVTSNDGQRDNGMICNAVIQLTDNPIRVAVTINKQNYTHHVVKQTGVMNVCCLSKDAPFSVFESFGFRSGRNVDKFADTEVLYADNGLPFLPRYSNAFMSLKVDQYVEFESHGMFICSITEARVLSDQETMTYTYYQSNVKPKPQTEGKKGFVCKICGYIYEGEVLPDDFICPLCKHGAADFEPIA